MNVQFVLLNFIVMTFCVTSYGHTYHPSCIKWHCRDSWKCAIGHCGKKFDTNWLLSYRFCPIVAYSPSKLQEEKEH